MDNNKISVLMGIYNCEATIADAITCIQNQSYSNWELILCDDGSIDQTYAIAKKMAEEDSRIVLIKNDTNCGLNHTLNRCLSLASGNFIARMDGDDLCDTQRFEKQLAFLGAHPEFDIVSTAMNLFDETGVYGIISKPEQPAAKQVVLGCPICHAPVMMRKSAMDAVGGYTEDRRMLRVEDVNLWIKLYAAGYRCYNMQEPLYSMRNDKNALNRRKYRYRVNSTYVRLQGCRMLHLGIVCYIRAFTPMVVGLIPARLRLFIRRELSKT